MSNQSKLKNIFAREEEREVGGETLTFHAPTAESAAKIEASQMDLAKSLKGSADGSDLSHEAIVAGKAFSQICVESVLKITAEEAKQLIVVVPSVVEEVNDFLGMGKTPSK